MVQLTEWVRPTRARVDHRASRSATVALCGASLGATPTWSNRAHAPCPRCLGRDPRRAAFIERMIDYLGGVEQLVIPPHAHSSSRISPKFFDGAEPFTDMDFTHGGRQTIEDHNLLPKDVAWPLDVKLIIPSESDDEVGWSLNRYRSLNAKDARGRVSLALPYPIEWTIGFPASGFVVRPLLGYAGPRRWVEIGHAGVAGRYDHTDAKADLSERVQLALELWSLRPSQWRIYFSLDDRPGIELPTDPLGAQEAFRLRDIPEGRARRAALRHWVTEHWRQSRIETGIETKVREHLRGAQNFDWAGLHCRITPSVLDLERAKDAADERQLDRVRGADRRGAPDAPARG